MFVIWCRAEDPPQPPDTSPEGPTAGPEAAAPQGPLEQQEHWPQGSRPSSDLARASSGRVTFLPCKRSVMSVLPVQV